MEVLAVERAGRWIYGPRGAFTLPRGDRVFAVGTEDGAAELEDLCATPEQKET